MSGGASNEVGKSNEVGEGPHTVWWPLLVSP
jgi:hypothetical protein